MNTSENRKLRILFLEDSELDAEIIVRLLTKTGYEISHGRVDTEELFDSALQNESWDLIVADYHLPSWTALDALHIYKKHRLEIPFIIVSGVIDEETAVAAMKTGAHDFITKGRLARLIPVIERELVEATLRESQRRSERDRALLSEAGQLMAATLDYDTALSNLAQIVAARFSDWCVVDIADEGGRLQRSKVAHHDPSKQSLLEELRRHVPQPGADSYAQRVFKTGTPLVVSVWTVDMRQKQFTLDDHHSRLLDALGCSSFVSVPLVAHGRKLGVLTACYSAPGRSYSEQDLEVAAELARRAAIIIDNARLYQQAQEANRLKDQFLAMVSHELRTPLTPILGAAMLLKGQVGSAANEGVIRKLIELIERNARVQAQIVDDLLDISRIVSGKLSLFTHPIDLVTVTRAGVDAFRAADSGSQLDVRVNVGPINGVVHGDAARLQQVLNNLLSNAVKFTPPGGSVTVSLAQTSDDWVEISVADTGKGISPEFLPFVFDRFRQADTFTTRSTGGLGLGLAITRDLVELHGGRVQAHSDGPGKGATFTVELPVHKENADVSSDDDRTGDARASSTSAAPASQFGPGSKTA